MSTFGGLTRATTALWAAQRGLDVTGQNISNVNTTGYSRQRVEQASMNGATVPAIWSVSDGVGSGVDSNTIIRIRDAFLEARGRLETAATARLTVESQALSQVEQAFREPGDTGIQSMLAEVWSGFSDVAKNPLDLAARSQVIERTSTLAAGIRTTANDLDEQWADTRTALGALVADVNATALSIADLNTKIQSGTLSGASVNELSDKRDGLVMKLAEQIGATAVARDGGMVDVVVGGTSLVSGRGAIALELVGTTGIGGVAGNPPRLTTVPGGTTIQPGGTAEGQLNVLTGTLPSYRASLDSLASGLAAALNTAHAAGLDLDGDAGIPLLGNGAGTGAVDPTLVTAANITVRVTNPRDVAAAGPAPGGGLTANGDNADAMYRLSLDPSGIDATLPRADRRARPPVGRVHPQPRRPDGGPEPGRRRARGSRRGQPRRGDDEHDVLPARLLGRGPPGDGHRRGAQHADQRHGRGGSLMRITQRAIAQTSLIGLYANQERIAKLQQQMTSGKVISTASDSPTGTNSAMQIRKDASAVEQQARNISDGKAWLEGADSAMDAMMQQVRRVRDLTVQGLNTGSLSDARADRPADRGGLAAGEPAGAGQPDDQRPAGLRRGDDGLAGLRPGLRRLRRGRRTSVDGGGVVTDLTVPLTRRISDSEVVRVDLTGAEAFGDQRTGRDLFAIVGDIADHVLTAGTDATDLRTDLGALDEAMNRLLTSAADIGSRAARLERAELVNTDLQLDAQGAAVRRRGDRPAPDDHGAQPAEDRLRGGPVAPPRAPSSPRSWTTSGDARPRRHDAAAGHGPAGARLPRPPRLRARHGGRGRAPVLAAVARRRRSPVPGHRPGPVLPGLRARAPAVGLRRPRPDRPGRRPAVLSRDGSPGGAGGRHGQPAGARGGQPRPRGARRRWY